MVCFPIAPFLVGSDLAPIEGAFDQFVDGLTNWQPKTDRTGLSLPPKVTVEANGYEAAFDRMNRLFLTNLWGDGLPVLPPTDERVGWILEGSNLPRDHVVGKIMPRGGIATVETLAVSLAMAGGRPEYLPVLTAAMQCILDPAVDHDKFQATSAATFPVVIVNGPIARQIRLNSGFGLLGPDPQQPAGASIGRAMRLLLQNVGGAIPGVGTMSIFGGMRYTNAVFAEDEEGLPEGWAPLNTEFGYAAGSNTVTMYVATGATNILRRGVGKETEEQEARESLHRVAGYLKAPNPHLAYHHETGTPGALLMSRVVAQQLVAAGWSKHRIRQFLWEQARISRQELKDAGIVQWIEAEGDPSAHADYGDLWPICARPDQLLLVVAGGSHPTHNFWMQAWSRCVVHAPIALPARWEMLIGQADAELGAGGEMCRIG